MIFYSVKDYLASSQKFKKGIIQANFNLHVSWYLNCLLTLSGNKYTNNL